MLHRLVARFRALFRRSRLEREMRAEMQAHLERATERLMARGLTASEARAAAQREFGGMDQIEESARDARGGRWLETTLADMRFALRQFRRTPVATVTMVALLVLGIGVNIALFMVIQSSLTQPPPGVERDASLVRIRGVNRSYNGVLSYPEVLEYAQRNELFRDVAAWTTSSAVLDVGDVEHGVIRGTAVYVTANYFDVLRVRPAMGAGLPRGLALEDVAAAQVAIISHGLWELEFGSRLDIIGKTLKVNGHAVTITGVTRQGFRGVDQYLDSRTVWLPLAARPLLEQSSLTAFSSPDSSMFRVAARLMPGVKRAAALPAVRTIAARVDAARSRPQPNATSDIVPLRANNAQPRRGGDDDAPAVIGAGVFTLLLLLITCTNVSTLLVGIAVTRRREIAVRLSLGAARARIIRQLLTESMLLALFAAVLGVFVTALVLRTVLTLSLDLPLQVAWPTVVFAVGLALVTGVIFGLSPALHATRLAVGEVLKDAASAVIATRSLLQRGLVIGQIALTQPLLVALGATTIITLSELNNNGATPSDRIAVLEFDMYAGNTTAEQRKGEITALTDRLAAIPGVAGAVPLAHGYGLMELAVHPADQGESALSRELLRIRTTSTPPGYFALMDIPFVRGRDLEPNEYRHDYSSIIIGSDLARRLWGGANPIGRRLVDSSDSSTVVVVGVVDEERAGSTSVGNELRIFVPSWSVLGSSVIYVRTHGAAASMLSAMQRVAREEAPQIPLRSAETLAAQQAAERQFLLRASAAVATGGLLALFLSAIGLYAVVSFAVGQRAREIGIRSALGAKTSEVVGMFFRGGLRLSLVGLAIGLPLSIVALRVITTQMGVRQVSAPLLAGGIAFFVLSVAATATWIPARRAARVDPLTVIRSE